MSRLSHPYSAVESNRATVARRSVSVWGTERERPQEVLNFRPPPHITLSLDAFRPPPDAQHTTKLPPIIIISDAERNPMDTAAPDEPPSEEGERRVVVWTPRSTGRKRKARVRYDPTPVSGRSLALAVARGDGSGMTPSEYSMEEIQAAIKHRKAEKLEEARIAAEAAAAEAAAQAEEARIAAEAAAAAAVVEAATPRPLPFSLPARDRPPEPMMLLTHHVLSDEGDQHHEVRRAPRRASVMSMTVDERLQACGHHPVEVVSEYSGIGALEHGLEAGFREASAEMQLIQATELDSTAAGRHASAVLRKRFPLCNVLNPDERKVQPYPASTRMLNVTAQCTEHSPLNTNRQPWKTEAMLEEVLERIEQSHNVEAIVFENVPAFLKVLEGQDRSSYAMWIEGIEQAGFTEHAYVTLPTACCGDLHHRTRLLSVHTRGCFHPAAALMRLVQDTPSLGAETVADQMRQSGVLAFNTGHSETRAAAKGGLGAVAGKLPAYNQSLNVALYAKGAFYKLSPWLAARCSGLPENYQDVGSKKRQLPGEEVTASGTDASIALANMVSPVQARELGNAIAREWRCPRKLFDIPALKDAPGLSTEVATVGGIPYEFPSGRSMTKHATLCFKSLSTGRWHQLQHAFWRIHPPEATLDQLVNEAISRGFVTLYPNLTDLNRVVDDESLDNAVRDAAEKQFRNMQAASNDSIRREVRDAWQRQMTRQHRMERALVRQRSGSKPTARSQVLPKRMRMSCMWVQCDDCLKWRRLSASPAGCARLPDQWRCSVDGIAPFNRCDVAEEEVVCGEDVGFDWKHEEDNAVFTTSNDRWLLDITKPFLDAFGDPDDNSLGIELKFRQRLLLSNARHPNLLALDYFFRSQSEVALERRVHELRALRDTGKESTQLVATDTSGQLVSGLSDQTVGIEDEPTHSDQPPLALTYTPMDEEGVVPSEIGSILNHSCEEGEPNDVERRSEGGMDEYEINHDQASSADSSEEDAFEDDGAEYEEPIITRIKRHHVFAGARSGSFFNVYVACAYSDGTATGGKRGGVEPIDNLLGRLEGYEVLRCYLDSSEGAGIAKFVPAYLAERYRLDRLDEARDQARSNAAAAFEDWKTRLVSGENDPKERSIVGEGGKRRRLSTPRPPIEDGERVSKALLSLADHLESCGGSKDMIEGWTAKIFHRGDGTSPARAGGQYTHFIDPRGKSFRSRNEVARFLSLDVRERGSHEQSTSTVETTHEFGITVEMGSALM